jgi:hypothetical protein
LEAIVNANIPGTSNDDAFDRLQSADPAAGAQADLRALDAAVRARIGDGDVSALPGVDGAAADPGVTSLAEVRTARASRRPARWLQIAAAVAGLAIVGTGGFALGRGKQPAPAAAAVISLGSAGVGDSGSKSSSAVGTEGLAPGLANPELANPSSAPGTASMRYIGSRTVFTSSGLSSSARSAEAWTFDAAAAFNRETAARIAKALGLAGSPTLTNGAWTVGSSKGVGPTLQIQPNATVSLNYYDPSLDPYSCGGATPDGTVKGRTEGSTTIAPAPAPGDVVSPQVACTPSSRGPAPSGAAAVARAKKLISGFGLDAAAFEFEATDTGSADIASVTAWQVVAGQRTGQVWGFSLVGDGIQSVWGQLAPVVSLGTYAVVSETDAVARLSDPRFENGYGGVMALDTGTVRGTVEPDAVAGSGSGSSSTSAPEKVAVPTLPPTPSAGSRVAWPVQHVTITKARLGLTFYTQPDGSALLLPAYELSSADGQTWSVLAVAESALDLSAAR